MDAAPKRAKTCPESPQLDDILKLLLSALEGGAGVADRGVGLTTNMIKAWNALGRALGSLGVRPATLPSTCSQWSCYCGAAGVGYDCGNVGEPTMQCASCGLRMHEACVLAAAGASSTHCPVCSRSSRSDALTEWMAGAASQFDWLDAAPVIERIRERIGSRKNAPVRVRLLISDVTFSAVNFSKVPRLAAAAVSPLGVRAPQLEGALKRTRSARSPAALLLALFEVEKVVELGSIWDPTDRESLSAEISSDALLYEDAWKTKPSSSPDWSFEDKQWLCFARLIPLEMRDNKLRFVWLGGKIAFWRL